MAFDPTGWRLRRRGTFYWRRRKFLVALYRRDLPLAVVITNAQTNKSKVSRNLPKVKYVPRLQGSSKKKIDVVGYINNNNNLTTILTAKCT